MGPGVITSRTLAFMTSFPGRGSVIPSPSRYQPGSALNRNPRVEKNSRVTSVTGRSGAAEEAGERAADLVGQGGVRRAAAGIQLGIQPGNELGNEPGTKRRLRPPDQAAVQALDLAQPPDQVGA